TPRKPITPGAARAGCPGRPIGKTTTPPTSWRRSSSTAPSSRASAAGRSSSLTSPRGSGGAGCRRAARKTSPGTCGPGCCSGPARTRRPIVVKRNGVVHVCDPLACGITYDPGCPLWGEKRAHDRTPERPGPVHDRTPCGPQKTGAQGGSVMRHARADDLFEPMPLSALPTPLAVFADEAAEAMGADPAYLALPALVVAA